MTNGYGFMIESLVAILLLLTIAYCVILNSRLKRLRADERVLKATIAELITATEIAERAVSGLKTTADECDQTLGERLRAAERCSEDLGRRVKSADVLIRRLSRILAAAQRDEAAPAGQDQLAAEVDVPAAPEPESETDVDMRATAPFERMPLGVPAPGLEAAPVKRRPAAPDPKAVAAAAQAFADRARSRRDSLAA